MSKVGIVVCSHSRPLAEAAVAFARAMSSIGSVRIEIAAGVDEHTLGTDAAAVATAIENADDGGRGVLVLMDLGSAVLSAETALEFVADDLRERVVLSPAPLVEGLFGAALQAATGASLSRVAAEAERGLAPKIAHLRQSPVT